MTQCRMVYGSVYVKETYCVPLYGSALEV